MQQLINKAEEELAYLIALHFPILKDKARELVNKDQVHFSVIPLDCNHQVLLNEVYQPVALGLSKINPSNISTVVKSMRTLAVLRAMMVNSSHGYAADIDMVNLGATNYLLKVLPSEWHHHVLGGRCFRDYLSSKDIVWG